MSITISQYFYNKLCVRLLRVVIGGQKSNFNYRFKLEPRRTKFGTSAHQEQWMMAKQAQNNKFVTKWILRENILAN